MTKVVKRLSHVKKHKHSSYRGIYMTKDGWVVRMSIKSKKYVYGPFNNEKEAAKFYDEKALKNLKDKAILNILKNPYQTPSKVIKKRKKIGSIHYDRKKFSIVTKHKICARQKWCCNYCNNLLSDIFIVDHIVPLFLGGSNAEFNLQALCPSCNQFKTSILDYQVLKPIADTKILTVDDVFQAQRNNYHKNMCIDPSLSTTVNNNSDPMNVNQFVDKNNGKRELELKISGINIKIFI